MHGLYSPTYIIDMRVVKLYHFLNRIAGTLWVEFIYTLRSDRVYNLHDYVPVMRNTRSICI